MPIYEKTTREIMHEFAKERLQPNQTFAKQDAINWFRERYPKIKSNTVGMHVEGMSTNSTLRKHHPHIRAGGGWDLFFKMAPGKYRLWNSASDQSPLYKSDLDHAISDSPGTVSIDIDEDQPLAADTEFALETDLRNYLVKNLHLLEPGLILYKDEDGSFNGVEFLAGSRRIDILAVGNDKAFVIVELKVSRGYEKVVGQLLRYMAWVKANLASNFPVRGIIVASEISEDLRLAASLVPGVQLVEYEIKFSLRPVNKQ